jgi:manganese-dependent inorganic pyrophosphatase
MVGIVEPVIRDHGGLPCLISATSGLLMKAAPMENRLHIHLYLLSLIIFLLFSPLSASSATYFIGHLEPDTDSIVSAIAAARFYGGVAARTGELNQESQYLLERVQCPAPILIQSFAGKEIGLVDFNQTTQAPADLKSENITKIIDHHALGDKPFSFARPIMITIKPWGSTASILADMFVRDNRPVTKELATLLLGAIVSDTLAFRSPTTTDKDRELAGVLQKIAGIAELETFAKDLFAAKSDLDSLSARQILLGDYKVFNIKGHKIGIAVAETVTPEKIIQQKDQLLKLMGEEKKKNELNFIFFFVVDILKANSTLFLLGESETSLAEKAFQVGSKCQMMRLPNLVSRKQQFIPLLSNAL